MQCHYCNEHPRLTKTQKAITLKAYGKRLSAAIFIIPGRRASKRLRRLCPRIRSGSNPESRQVGMWSPPMGKQCGERFRTRENARTTVTSPLLETKRGGPEAEMALRRLKIATSKYDRLTENLKSAQVVRNEVVEVGANPIECVVVRGEYDAPRGSAGIKAITKTYWIDKVARSSCAKRMSHKGIYRQ